MRKIASLLPVFAWLVGVSLSLWFRSLLNVAGAAVLVPLVSVSDRAGRDVVSDVTGFALAIVWGLVCALLIEPAKAGAHAARRPLAVYSLLLAYQIVLVADTIRAHTFDWWKWLLSLTGAVALPMFPEAQDMPGFRFPWVSCVVAVVTSLVVFRSFANGGQADAVPAGVPG